jgi:hypothetical protein
MAMQRSLGDICSVIDSVGQIFEDEHSAASFLSRTMEDGDKLDTEHLPCIAEFGSNETSVASSQSRIEPVVLAVELKGIASEETTGSTNDEWSSEVAQC